MKKLQPGEEFDYSGWIWIPSNDNGKVTFKPIRESSVKKEKVKKEVIIPTEQEIKDYASNNGYDPVFMWEKAKGYIDAGMKDSKGNDVKNLKLKLNQVWFQPQHKIKTKEATSQQEFFKEAL